MENGKIFVGGLSWDSEKDALNSYFSQFGEVTDCVVMKNPQTQKSRGFGFVTFSDPSVVEVVLSSPEHKIDGRTVDAKPCSARGSGGSGGGFQGGKPAGGGGGGRGGSGFTGRTTKIFVGGLPNDTSDDNLKSFFSKYGQVTEVVIMYDQEKQRSRGFGFLTFDSEDAVEAAVKEHFVDFNGKKVECKRAEPRQGGGGRGGGGGGRGRGGYSQSWGGMGDGSQGWGGQSQMYSYSGAQQPSYGGYQQPSYEQSWGGQSYGGEQGYSGQQAYGGQQSWGGQQGYGQSWGSSPGYTAQPSWQQNGQGQDNGGYGNQGYNNYSGGQGSGGGGGYGNGYSSQDGYGGGKTSSTGNGGGSQGYHPYKRQ